MLSFLCSGRCTKITTWHSSLQGGKRWAFLCGFLSVCVFVPTWFPGPLSVLSLVFGHLLRLGFYSCNVSRASALTCLISRLLRCSRSFSIACFGSHVHGFLHNSVSCVVVSMQQFSFTVRLTFLEWVSEEANMLTKAFVKISRHLSNLMDWWVNTCRYFHTHQVTWEVFKVIYLFISLRS